MYGLKSSNLWDKLYEVSITRLFNPLHVNNWQNLGLRLDPAEPRQLAEKEFTKRGESFLQLMTQEESLPDPPILPTKPPSREWEPPRSLNVNGQKEEQKSEDT